jgi:hypothetical protein
MAIWLQNFVVLAAVAACLGYVGWQAVRALSGRRSKVGGCCAKGCATVALEQQNKAAEPKVQFMPVEMLARRRS